MEHNTTQPTLSVCLFQLDHILPVQEMLFHQGVVDIWLSTDLQRGREPRQGEGGYPQDVEKTHVGWCNVWSTECPV